MHNLENWPIGICTGRGVGGLRDLSGIADEKRRRTRTNLKAHEVA